MSALKEIVHYICSNFEKDPEILGTVKLNKICWFSDVDRLFLTNNKTISGYKTYIKMPQGPVLPQIKDVLTDLAIEKKISTTLLEFEDYKHWYYLNLEPPTLSLLDKNEIEIIDFWINYAKTVTSAQISTEAHDYPWWDKARNKSTIPVGYGFFKNSPIKESALSYDSVFTNF